MKKLKVYIMDTYTWSGEIRRTVSDTVISRIESDESGEIERLRSEVSNLIDIVATLCEALAVSGTLSKSDLESILGSRFEVCNAAE